MKSCPALVLLIIFLVDCYNKRQTGLATRTRIIKCCGNTRCFSNSTGPPKYSEIYTHENQNSTVTPKYLKKDPITKPNSKKPPKYSKKYTVVTPNVEEPEAEETKVNCPLIQCKVKETFEVVCPGDRNYNETCYWKDGYFWFNGREVIYLTTERENMKTWKDAAEHCCSMNMSLMTVHNVLAVAGERNSTWLSNPLVDKRIWECELDSEPRPLFEDYFAWTNSSSGINDSCVSAQNFTKNANRSLNFLLSADKCDTLNNYACQQSLIDKASNAKKIINASEIVLQNKEPIYFSCKRDYMAYIDKVSIYAARRECCKYGLKLVQLDSKLELKCILKFLKGNSGSYWTDGTNKGASNIENYGYCHPLQLLDKGLWAEDQPWDPENNQCVSLYVEQDVENLSGLASAHCSLKMPFICVFPEQE